MRIVRFVCMLIVLKNPTPCDKPEQKNSMSIKKNRNFKVYLFSTTEFVYLLVFELWTFEAFDCIRGKKNYKKFDIFLEDQRPESINIGRFVSHRNQFMTPPFLALTSRVTLRWSSEGRSPETIDIGFFENS